MRTLKFIVNGQIITQDPSCDFSGLVPGSDGYLKAEFSFSKEWDGCVKAAAFYSRLGKEYDPQMLKDGKSCVIPAEALSKKIFKVQIQGRNTKTNQSLTTNKVVVNQNGGAV